MIDHHPTGRPEPLDPLSAIEMIAWRMAGGTPTGPDPLPEDMLAAWADIERHANPAARHAVGQILGAAARSLTKDEYAEAIDWARIAALAGQPSAEAARAHYPPEPPF
jgi:hypothetical protein